MQSENPYAPPASIPTELSPATDAMSVASQGKRFVNMLLDSILIQVFAAGVGFVVGVVYVFSKDDPTQLDPNDDLRLNLLGYAVGIVVSLAYFILTETIWQRSPAKFLTGTRVVTADGGMPTLGQIVGRTFARFIPFEAFSFLGASEPVGWHDSLSKTRVVTVRS